MAIQTNKSRMALVREVTEGTPVSPTAGTQYVALQSGFELTPNFATLENAELTGNIGAAAPVLGLEEPSASLSHYLRHSGVEGQEPNYGLLLEGAFGGKSVNATEYDTTAGSSAGTASARASLNVGVGEGAQFERGEGLLIKDGVNGYRIRAVESVVSDALKLSFNLPNAPAAGVNLGKAVLYKPQDTGPTMTAWDYRGNGGAVQMVSGLRVSEMSVEVAAGEFVNTSFSMDGLSFYYDPIQITSTTNTIDFTDDVGPVTATMPQGFYKDPRDAAAALAAAMTQASVGSGNDTITVTYNDSTGLFTVASNGTTFAPDWATTVNTLGAKFGFTADDSGSTSYTSDVALTLTSPQTPAFDASNPLVAKDNEVMVGGFDDYACFGASSITFTLSNETVPVTSVCEESGRAAIVNSARTVTVEITSQLVQYATEEFTKFREGTTVQFQYSFGVKSGGNWVPGKCGVIYIPTAKINAFSLTDEDGIARLQMTLTAFVENAQGEAYLSLL